MLKISHECVRLLATAGEAVHTLEYFGNLYERKTTFTLGQKTEAEDLWCHLTDNTSNICLLVTEPLVYSLWVLIDSPKDLSQVQSSQYSLQPAASQAVGKAVPNLVIHLLRSLWPLLTELGGVERAKAFGRDVIASDLPIDSEADLQACLRITPPPIDRSELDRGRQIIDRFQYLARQQVGLEAVTDIVDRLPIAEMSFSRLF
jgi:hypothetical protein